MRVSQTEVVQVGTKREQWREAEEELLALSV